MVFPEREGHHSTVSALNVKNRGPVLLVRFQFESSNCVESFSSNMGSQKFLVRLFLGPTWPAALSGALPSFGSVTMSSSSGHPALQVSSEEEDNGASQVVLGFR